MRDFGFGAPVTTIISNAALAITIIFSILSIGSLLNLDTYSFFRGTTFHAYFNENHPTGIYDALIASTTLVVWVLLLSMRALGLISLIVLASIFLSVSTIWGWEYGLMVIGSLSIPSIASLVLVTKAFGHSSICRVPPNKFGQGEFKLSILYLLVIILVMSALSVLVTISPELNEQDDYLYHLTSLISRFSPLFMFLAIFSFALKIIFDQVITKSKNLQKLRGSMVIQHYGMSKEKRISFLIAILASSTLIAGLPYFQFSDDGSIVTRNSTVGVDTAEYQDLLRKLHSERDYSQVIYQSFANISSGDRPLTLLALHLLSSYTGLDDDDNGIILETLLAMTFSPLLAFATFQVAHNLSRNDYLSLISAFLTTISFQILIGIYGGLFANWLSLIFCYFSIAYLFRFLHRSSHSISYLDGICFSVLLVASLLAHSYTWTIIVLFLGIFLAVYMSIKVHRRKIITIALLLILPSVFIDIGKGLLTSSVFGFERDLAVAGSTESGLNQFAQRWSNLVRTLQVHFGGIFGANFVIILLSFFSVIWVDRRQNLELAVFITTFLSIAFIPMFFGNTIILSRVLYEIPFQIPAAVGIIMVIQALQKQRLSNILVATSVLAVTFAISLKYALNIGQ